MNKKRIGILIISIFLLSFSACTVYREVDRIGFSESDQSDVGLTGYIYDMERASADIGTVTEALFGKTFTDAMRYYSDRYGEFVVDGVELTLAHNSRGISLTEDQNQGEFDAFDYRDYNEGAYPCYDNVLSALISSGLQTYTIREQFPLEDLDSCTKEEAIEACKAYAELFGYKDAEVSVYAVTLDILEQQANEAGEIYLGAPAPGYEIVTKQMIQDLRDEGKEDKANELLTYRSTAASFREIPWEKKHEVIVLTYQPYLEGNIMQESEQYLKIIYSPLYERPVSMVGIIPYTPEEVLEEKPVISKEEAVAKMHLIHGYDLAEDVDIRSVSLKYMLQSVGVDENLLSLYRAIPCWNVEYIYENKLNHILIEAIGGDQYTTHIGG